ncbi:MAG: alpha/beta hydrolase, partial [Nanoarchaeota archaeon]|nr:alpha/beta hydrolase [Nanoarchaeota archaeon]
MKKYTLFLISLIMCSFVAADAIDEAYIVQEQTEYETLYAQINTLVNGASATEPGGRRIHECYSKFDADTYQLNWDYSDGLGIRNQGVLDCVDKKNADPEIRGVEQIWVSCIHEKANPIDKVYYGTLLKHAKDALACMEGIECKINGLYDGVVADGVSEITFTLEKPGTLELVTVGELKGEITKQTSSLITFKPDEADAEKNYLKPQKVTVKAECDRGGTAEKEFTIEQPPLLLLHGILGSSETWSSFMPWLNSDGFSFKAISYSNTGDIVVNAKSVDSIIEKFI